MNFKKKQIGKAPKPKHIRLNSTKHISISAPIIVSIVIIFVLLGGIVKAVKSIDLSVLLTIAGQELETDVYGHSNFLILGTGGENHEGGNLTDSIIVASIDDGNKLISMLSIPRDLYIKDNVVGSSKINEVYFNAAHHFGSSMEGLEYMKKKTEELMGIPIHYWVKIDFSGFKDLVDALGGIEIDVKEAIYDPYYPLDGTYDYEAFSIRAGLQHMDGEIALKYARSRKTTSDFDRAKRQQQIIYAIKEKALQTNTFLSQEKIEKILTALKKNIETNIKVKEILTLGAMASDYDEDKISHRLIHDDPNRCGGFLYTPGREYYGGMFVLIPAGGNQFLHWYAELAFSNPLIAHENAKIHIMNGTGTPGIAGENKQILQRYCFDITRFSNARTQKISETIYYYEQKYDEDGDPIDSRPHALDFIQKLIPGKESTEIPQEYITEGYLQEADLLIEIGSDYATSEDYVDDPFYYLPPAKVYTPEATEDVKE